MRKEFKGTVLPLNDMAEFVALEFHVPVPASGTYTYYPNTTQIPERSAANVHGVSYKILAEIEIAAKAEGVIFAQGSRFGGHTLFIKDGQLTDAYNFLGIPPEVTITGPAPGPGKHIVGVDFIKKRKGEYNESYGPLKLYVDNKVIAEAEIRTQTGHFSLCGEGLCIPAGRSSRLFLTSRMMPTSMSSGTWSQRCRATS